MTQVRMPQPRATMREEDQNNARAFLRRWYDTGDNTYFDCAVKIVGEWDARMMYHEMLKDDSIDYAHDEDEEVTT